MGGRPGLGGGLSGVGAGGQGQGGSKLPPSLQAKIDVSSGSGSGLGVGGSWDVKGFGSLIVMVGVVVLDLLVGHGDEV